MVGIPDLDKNAPAKVPEDEAVKGGSEAEMAHRRMEHNADQAAKRAGERMRKDEAGNDEFSNM